MRNTARRSYIVKTQSGAKICRNRCGLKPYHSDRSSDTTSFNDPEETPSLGEKVLIQPTTKCDGTVRKPERLIENHFIGRERRYYEE